ADSIVRLDAGGRVTHGPSREVLADSPIRPPLVDLGARQGWTPLPLTIREGRRHAAEARRGWVEEPPALPAAGTPGTVVLGAKGLVVRYPRVVALRDVDLT